MKNTINSFRGLLVLAPLFISTASFAQGETSLKWKDNNLFDRKVFVENKGQFDGKDGLKNSQIKFGFDNLGFQTYFTNTGLTYRMEEWGKSEADKKRLMDEITEEFKTPGGKHSEREMREEDELKRSDLLKSSIIHMEWVGSNPNAQIIASNKAVEYFNYPGPTPDKNIDFCSSYNTITYKNLYPGVDLVYSFPQGKQGTKYALIIQPGADVSKIKMKYTGAESISLDKDGNILINNGFGDIIDHAPLTFYNNNKKNITSSFKLNGNEVSFNLDAFDNSQMIVIDPWTTNPNFTITNKSWSVEVDALGNFYVEGGLNPYKLMKYTSAGVALWTTNVFNGLPGANLNWHTTHATDNNGNSFCCLAYTTGWLQKINNAGVAVVTNTNAATGVGGSYETFYPKFDKTKTQLIAGCTIGQCKIANINQATCVLNGLAGYASFGMEVRDLCPSDNGNFYGICIDGGGANTSKVFGVTPAFGMLWNTLSGYVNANYGYFAPSIAYGSPGPRNTMAASKCYVYTYNGSILYKRNIGTGAFVASVTVGGGVAGSCAGIIVDSCENVYVGTTTGISKFGSNLAFITSANTAGSIYDIEFGVNNEIYACGMAVCASVAGLKQPCIVGTMTLNPGTGPALCSTNTGSAAIVSVLGGIGPYTYTWSTGANTSSLTNIPPGIYTVTVQDNSCIPMTKTISITVLATPGSTVSISASSSVACNGFSTGIATASINGGTGPYTYTWSNNQNTQTATNLSVGIYTVVTKDANGCLSSTTISITEPPPITGTVTSSNVLCNAGTTGSANVNGGGGTGALNYSWSNGPTTQPDLNLAAGIYSVVIKDANNCIKIMTVQIAQPNALTLTINTSTTNICAGSVINANSFASGGTGPYTYTWNPGPTASGYNISEAIAGNYNYILNATDANGCPVTNNINLTFNPIPVVAATSQTVCLGQKVVLTANGADTYVWMPGNVVGNTFTTTGSSNMFLTVVGTAIAGGCSSSATAAVVVNPLPTAQIAASNNKACVPLCMTFTASNSNGSIQNCSWDFGDGSFASNVVNANRCFNVAGNYVVNATITDNNGCTSSTTFSLETYPIPMADFNFSPLKPIENDEVIFTDATHEAVIAKWDWYFMNLPKPHSNSQNPTFIYDQAGTYPIALLVTSNHGCVDTIVKTIVVGEDYGIYVPNVFSPNGDGLNDVFQPKGFGITKYELRLFNRWGEELMFTNDFAHGWDGYYKGKLSKEDTYIWKINLTNVFGKSHELSGNVTLIK